MAAGASTRMGKPKQLLRYEGETLISRAVRSAQESKCCRVIVVLGAHASVVRDEIAETVASVVINQAWDEGMSSSIRCGLSVLEASGEIEAAILLLCDQPFVTSKVINRLTDTYYARRPPLVVSEYETGGERTQGVPALFSRALFPELMSLSGAEGAKRIIARHASEAVCVAVPEAVFDVDTPDDYYLLCNNIAQGI